ncbi:MAG: hypothetical protein IMY73_00600 [Bacteroidetes bacterium]|nr:hypothetical protein [Bacteroidota bacterium]
MSQKKENTISSINSNKKRVSDRFSTKSGKSVNDFYSKNRIKKGVKIDEKHPLQNLLPFAKAQKSLDDWLYRNRKEVVFVSITYLIILLSIMFVRYDMVDYNTIGSVYIDVPIEEIEQPKIETKKQKEDKRFVEEMKRMASEPVKNVAVDENNNLDTELKDEKNINSDELYEEAKKVQQELEANRASYKKGLQDVNNEESAIPSGDDSQKDIGNSNENVIAGKSVVKGNVTVSFNLKGRKVIYLEIPAYRCQRGGRVVVNIVVEADGYVSSAEAVSGSGLSDSCLKEMSEEAATLSRFTIDKNSSDSQKGHITYLFISQ